MTLSRSDVMSPSFCRVDDMADDDMLYDLPAITVYGVGMVVNQRFLRKVMSESMN